MELRKITVHASVDTAVENIPVRFDSTGVDQSNGRAYKFAQYGGDDESGLSLRLDVATYEVLIHGRAVVTVIGVMDWQDAVNIAIASAPPRCPACNGLGFEFDGDDAEPCCHIDCTVRDNRPVYGPVDPRAWIAEITCEDCGRVGFGCTCETDLDPEDLADWLDGDIENGPRTYLPESAYDGALDRIVERLARFGTVNRPPTDLDVDLMMSDVAEVQAGPVPASEGASDQSDTDWLLATVEHLRSTGFISPNAVLVLATETK